MSGTTEPKRCNRTAGWLAAGAGFAVAAYVTHIALTWQRYGRLTPSTDDDADPLLDEFMPEYEVVERHHVRIDAPAELTLAAAKEMDLSRLPLVRAIFKGRQLILGAEPDQPSDARGLLAQVQSLGWRVLAERTGCEVVVGAVTKPWEPNVTFRGIAPRDFINFDEPGYAKIAWTLRADPVGSTASVFRTETRVMTTDAISRAKFRRYWAFLSPGIRLIRRAMLGPLKADAERRARPSRDFGSHQSRSEVSS